MTPITYYPPVMQRQLLLAEPVLAASEYARHLRTDLTLPESAARAVQRGPINDAEPPTIEALNHMLDPDYHVSDQGYGVIDGPTLHVRSRVDFPGSTPDMFRWWFWWHPLDAKRYMLWFPYSHIEARAEDPERLANSALSFEERFHDNRQHVVEYMGSDRFESVIRFCDPQLLGFDMERYAAAGFEASASGLLEVPGLPDVTVGMMVHFVRPTAGGMELVSRYWLGSHPALARFPGAERAPDVLAAGGMTQEKMESVAYELAVHDMTEWNNLAVILPALYAEFGS